LPWPEADAYAVREYEAPEGEIEQKLAEIWAQVLKVDRVGRHDDFFELGGHSLLAVDVVSRMRPVLDMEATISDLFTHPKLSDFASGLKGAIRTKLPPIVRVDRRERLPLSFAQQQLWFADQVEPGGAAYNVPEAMRLKGKLDSGALHSAVNEIVRRHEILRTTFVAENGEPTQLIRDAVRVDLPVEDLRGMDLSEDKLRELVHDEARRPFNLSRGPLLRARLLTLDDEDHVLQITMHHIVSDAWSARIWRRELKEFYEVFTEAGKPSPKELLVQYADYAVWQRGWLKAEFLAEQVNYWKEQLKHAPVLELPTDKGLRVRPGDETGRVRFTLSEDLTSKLKDLSQREGATIFMGLLAAFQLLLGRYSNEEDIIVGTDVANRGAEAEGLIGYFINQLPLRTDLSGNPSFRELLSRVRKVCLDAYSHQDLPFHMLVQELQPARELGRAPVFQVLFGLQNEPGVQQQLKGLEVEPLEVDVKQAHMDLEVYASEQGACIDLNCFYKRAVFQEALIVRMLQHYSQILKRISIDADQPVGSIDLLLEEERLKVLVGNDTVRTLPDATVPELFEAQVEKTPDAVAVAFREKRLTYQELNRRANQLANYLRSVPIGTEVPVALHLARSIDMVIAILGVLKAGGAYMPIDVDSPPARVQNQITDAHARMVLTDHFLRNLKLTQHSDENLVALTEQQNLAYIIYTSGSTGQPKGVGIEHGGMLNHLFAKIGDLELSAGDVVAQTAAMSFDIAVWQTLAALLVGGRVEIIPGETSRDGASLLRTVTLSQVTILETVPVLFTAMLDVAEREGAWPPIRHTLITGEPLPADSCRRWHFLNDGTGRLWNAYGPTECSDDVTHHPVARDEVQGKLRFARIGKPIINTRVYILDQNVQPVPIGVAGELYISGAGVGRGYLSLPTVTAERFLPDPFTSEAGARMYRTGDLGRWSEDGTIEFLGRNDDQVKIRGYRIELGEIEATLRMHPVVRDAVVVARQEETGEKRLVGYVIARPGNSGMPHELREFLKGKLPEYMWPTAFVALEAFPMTQSGKVNRKALPDPSDSISDEEQYLAPRTRTEEILCGIWEKVLKVERVGVRDNFFDLGGHSLLATQISSQIRQVFGIELELRRLFEAVCITQLAEVIEEMLLTEIERIEDEEAVRLVDQQGLRLE
jgi:amino acid adenylation domain-containing protein